MNIYAPYTCPFCGAPSWCPPSEASMPADYCDDSNHGLEADKAEPDDLP